MIKCENTNRELFLTFIGACLCSFIGGMSVMAYFGWIITYNLIMIRSKEK